MYVNSKIFYTRTSKASFAKRIFFSFDEIQILGIEIRSGKGLNLKASGISTSTVLKHSLRPLWQMFSSKATIIVDPYIFLRTMARSDQLNRPNELSWRLSERQTVGVVSPPVTSEKHLPRT